MTLLPLLRMLGALAFVLGLLGVALWAVRRFGLRFPGATLLGPPQDRRLKLVERLSVDPRRTLVLLQRDGVEHLLLLAPEGNIVVERHAAPLTGEGA